MGSLNWKRVFGGGLVATLVLMVGEFAIEPLMGPQMADFFSRLGLPEPGEEAMMGFALAIVLTGIATVWLYAAIRPRYGAGPGSAIIAGVVVWLLGCLAPNLVMLAFGLYTVSLFWFASLWPLVEGVAAALAGAWVYRE